MEDKPGGKDRGKLHEAGPGDSPVSEQFLVGFNRLKSLINTGGSVSQNDLDEALHSGEINTLECFELTRRLSKRREVENEELRIALEKAGIDGLTGLLRREHLEPALYDYILELNYNKKENERRERKAPSLNSVAIFFIDLDFLKNLNDEYGYHAGDAALVALADRLRTVFSKRKNSGFRYGGDEFVCLEPIEDENTNFASFLDRIRKAMTHNLFAEFKHGDQMIRVPISATTGCFVLEKGDSRTPKLILEEASKKMQALKKELGIQR